MKSMRLACMLLAAVMVFSLAGKTALAADYPTRPITFICPWGAGGGSDAVARIISTLLQKDLGVPVNVVNRTGGSGVIGHTAIAMSKPDGYTIGLPTVEITMMHWLGLTKLTYESMEPIAIMNFDPAGITVREDAAWKQYPDLRKDLLGGAKLSTSGSGQGSIWHLAMAGLMQTLKAPEPSKWIPSTGGARALQDLMAGGVDYVTCSLPEASTLIDAGRVKPLAIMAAERDPQFPDVPTLKEMGTDWVCGAWRGVAAPKGTPTEILDILGKAMAKIVKSDEYVKFMKNRGYGILYKDRNEFAAMLKHDDEVNGKILKEAHVAQ